MPSDMPHEPEGAQPVDALIDDLILDILNDSKKHGTAGTAGLDAVLAAVPKLAPGTPLLERVLLAEALSGALADALAPSLAKALAPRIVQAMTGEEAAKRTPARSGSRKGEQK